MWQRVQTLYLFISTALVFSMFFMDKTADVSYLSYFPYAILLSVILALDLLALGSYKFRVFQMRTAILSALITLAFQAWLAFDFFTSSKGVAWSFTAVFPFVCVILDVLAAAGIWSDEMIVRTSDRLRAAKRRK